MLPESDTRLPVLLLVLQLLRTEITTIAGRRRCIRLSPYNDHTVYKCHSAWIYTIKSGDRYSPSPAEAISSPVFKGPISSNSSNDASNTYH